MSRSNDPRTRRALGVAAALATLAAPAPALSAFGGSPGRIAFAADCAIHAVQPDGTSAQAITFPRPTQCDGFDSGPEISPDGFKAVFTRTDRAPNGEQSTELVIVDLANGALTFLTATAEIDEASPTWAPDGRTIAFVAGRRRSDGVLVGPIHALDTVTHARTALTTGEDATPDFSASNELAFVRVADGRRRLMVRSSAGVERDLGHEGALHPDFSPDGTRIAIADMRDASALATEGIRIVDVPTARSVGIVPGTHVTAKDVPWAPAFSPDGKRLAFVRGGGGAVGLAGTLHSIAVNGTDERTLTSAGGVLWMAQPDWQPVAPLLAGVVEQVCRAIPPSPGGGIVFQPPELPRLPVPIPQLGLGGSPCETLTAAGRVADQQIFTLPGGRAFHSFLRERDARRAADEAQREAAEWAGAIPFPSVVANQVVRYRIRMRVSGGRIAVHEQEGLVGRIVALDADRDGTSDAAAQLLPTVGQEGVRLCVMPGGGLLPDPSNGCTVPRTELGGVSGTPKPVAVEVFFDDRLDPRRGTATSRVAFGYDALDSVMPRLFDATLVKVAAKTYRVGVRNVAPGPALALIAELEGLEPGEEAWVKGRARFQPVPASLGVGLRAQQDLRVETLATDESIVTANVDVVQPNKPRRRIDARIERLPAGTRTQPDQILGALSSAITYTADEDRLLLESAARIRKADVTYTEHRASGPMAIHAVADDLPAIALLEIGSDAGAFTAHYQADGGLAQLALDIADPAGLAGRATELHAVAHGLPRRVDMRLGADSHEWITASGDKIALAEVLLIDSSSPEAPNRLPGRDNGVLLRDTDQTFALFARATDLRALSLTRSANDTGAACGAGFTLCATIDKDAESVLRIDLLRPRREDPGESEFVRSTLTRLLPGTTTLRFGSTTGFNGSADPAATKTLVEFAAPGDAPGSRLDLDTGVIWRHPWPAPSTHLDLSPVPARLDVCQSSQLVCGPRPDDLLGRWSRAFEGPVAALDMVAADAAGKPTEVVANLRDFEDDLNWVDVRGLRFSKLALQASTSVDRDTGCGGPPLYFYADTGDLRVSGSGDLVDRCGDKTSRARFVLPGVRASSRWFTTDRFTFLDDHGGSMHCPPGTVIKFLGAGLFADVDMDGQFCTSR